MFISSMLDDMVSHTFKSQNSGIQKVSLKSPNNKLSDIRVHIQCHLYQTLGHGASQLDFIVEPTSGQPMYSD